MVGKNNFKNKMKNEAEQKQHFGIRKFSIGVASVLLSTTLYFAGVSMTANNVQAATVEQNAQPNAVTENNEDQSKATNQNDKVTEPTKEVPEKQNGGVQETSSDSHEDQNQSEDSSQDRKPVVVTRTIHYVDSDNKKIAADRVQTMKFVPVKHVIKYEDGRGHQDDRDIYRGPDDPSIRKPPHIEADGTIVKTRAIAYRTRITDYFHQGEVIYHNWKYEKKDFIVSSASDKPDFEPYKSKDFPDRIEVFYDYNVESNDGNQDANNPLTATFLKIYQPKIKGYRLVDSSQLKVDDDVQWIPEESVTINPITDSRINKEITLRYALDKQTAQWQFVDDDENGKPVGEPVTITGKVNETVDLSQKLTIPENYKLAKNQTLPTSYTFKANNNSPVDIHLVHKTAPVDKNEIDPATGKTVVLSVDRQYRVIENQPNGKGEKEIGSEEIKATRSAIKDLVSGKIYYSLWDYKDLKDGQEPIGNDGYWEKEIDKFNGYDPVLRKELLDKHWKLEKLSDNNISDYYVWNVHTKFSDFQLSLYFANDKGKAGISFDHSSLVGNGKPSINEKDDPKGYYVSDSGYDKDIIATLPPSQNFYVDFIANQDQVVTKTQTIHYVDEQGNKLADDNVQSLEFYPVQVEDGRNYRNDKIIHRITHQTDKNLGKNITKIYYRLRFTHSLYHEGDSRHITYSPWTLQESPDESGQDGILWDIPNQNDIPGNVIEHIKDTDPVSFNPVTSPATITKNGIIYCLKNVNQEKVPGATGSKITLPSDTQISVVYVPQEQKANYQFVDDDENGKKVGEPVTITGKVNETVDLNYTVPENYDLVANQPTKYTFTTKNDPINIHLVHKHKQLKDGDTNPTDGSKVHATTTRQYKVVENLPSGTKTIETKNIIYSRDVEYDCVTKKVTNSPWAIIDNGSDAPDGTFYIFHTIDNVNGYTAKLRKPIGNCKIDEHVEGLDKNNSYHWDVQELEENSKNCIGFYSEGSMINLVSYLVDAVNDEKDLIPSQDFYIDYIANSQTNTYQFVDDDNNGAKVGGPVTITGTTGQTVALNYTVPENYVLADNQPARYTFKASDNDPLTIHLKHQVVDVTNDKDNKDKDTNRSYYDMCHVDREYKVVDKMPTPESNPTKYGNDKELLDWHLEFKRNATLDKTTNKVTYGQWEATDGNGKTFYLSRPESSTIPWSTKGDTNSSPVIVSQQAMSIGIPGYKVKGTGYPFENPDGLATNAGSANGFNNVLATAAIAATQKELDNSAAGKPSGVLKSKTFYVIHEPILQTDTYQFVDDDNNKAVVGEPVSITGVTDQTIDLNYTVPNKYVLADDKQPTTYTFKASDNKLVIIHLKHKTQPATNQITVTRDVHYKDPITNEEKIVKPQQQATFTRTGVTDLVTGTTTYPDWKSQTFEQVDAPNIPGYTVLNPNAAPSITVNGDTKSSTVVFNYTANDQKQVINYVDSSNNVVISTTAKGKTNETKTVDINNGIPAGWVLVPGQNLPTSIIFGTTTKPAINIQVEHGTKQADTQNRTVTRTVSYTDPKTGKEVLVKTQKADFTRTGVTDLVTGKTTYPEWKSQTFEQVDAPNIPGYTVTNSEAASQITVDGDDESTTALFTYKATTQTQVINYVDSSDNNVVNTTTVTGKTNQTKNNININSGIPAGWVLVPGQTLPSSITFGPTDGDPINIQIKHGTKSNTETKIVERHVSYTDPNTGATKAVADQSVELTRQVTTDLVTGTETRGEWSKNKFERVKAPNIPGYTVEPTEAPEEEVTGDTHNSYINFHYFAIEQELLIKYVDSSGVVHKTDDVKGDTGATVCYTSVAPEGWKIVPGQNIPTTITFGPYRQKDINIKIEHAHKVVNPGENHKKDDPIDPTDKDPKSPKYNEDIGNKQLIKSVSQVVNKYDTDDKLATTNIQTLNYQRSTVVDEVTGKIDLKFNGTADGIKFTNGYSDWTASDDASKNGFSEVALKLVDGYTADDPITSLTPSSTDVESWNNENHKFDLRYTPNQQTNTYQFVDDNNGEVVGNAVTINGVTDQTVGLNYTVPENYVLADDNQPTQYTFQASKNEPILIHLKHKTEAATQTRTVTRTVSYKNPKTGEEVLVKTQKAEFTRTVKTDLVTGKTTYPEWKNLQPQTFDKVDAPTIADYKVSNPNAASKITVTGDAENTRVVFTYEATTQTQVINYIDSFSGTRLYSENVKGKIGTTKSININSGIPHGWNLVPGQKLPDTITFGALSGEPINVLVEHPREPEFRYEEMQKVITREVGYHDPQTGVYNHIITQNVTVFNKIKINTTTGEKFSSGWSTQTLKRVDAPTIPGYTVINPDAAKKITVDGSLSSIKIVFEYIANDSHQDFEFVDEKDQPAKDQNGNPIPTDHKTGLTGRTVPVPTIPTGWEEVGQPKDNQGNPVDLADLKFKPEEDKSTPIKVTIKHGTVTVKPTDPKKPSDVIPNDGDKKFPEGVDQDDLNKDITQVVYETLPGQDKKQLSSQTLHFERTATVDKVTGEVTKYSDWVAKNKDAKSFTKINATEATGYTEHYSAEQVINPSKDQISSWNNDDHIIEITYTANPASAHISYYDDEAGSEIEHDDAQGHFGETINFTKDPDAKIAELEGKGYVFDHVEAVAKQQTNPMFVSLFATTPSRFGKKTFDDDKNLISFVVHFKHAHKTIDKDHIPGKNPGEKTPIDDNKPGDHKVTEEDFKKDVNRTITINTPIGKVTSDENGKHVVTQPDTSKSQKVTLERKGDYDCITGKVTWKPWSTGKFDEVAVPDIDGYKKSKEKIGKIETVDENFVDPKETVDYTPLEQHTHIDYKDEKGKTIHQQPINGVTDETVQVTPEIPTGWELDDGQQIPSSVTLRGKDNKDLVVTIKHATVTVKPTDPKKPSDVIPNDGDKKFPEGVDQNDLNKDITQIVNETLPGQDKKQLSSQTLHFERTATVDKVTGEVLGYSEWTPKNNGAKSFTKISATGAKGYTAHYSAEQVIKPTNDQISSWKNDEHIIEITYTANATNPGSGDNGQGSEEQPTDQPSEPSDLNNGGKDTEADTPTDDGGKDNHPSTPSGHKPGNKKGADGKEPTNQKGKNGPLAPSSSNTKQGQAQTELPQTGEKQDQLGVIGLALASIAGFLGLASDRKRKN